MSTARLFRLAGLLLLGSGLSAAHAQIYVDTDAVGANDGSSWANAYTSLRDGLAAASSGDEVWVAEGVYYPDEGAGLVDNDRTNAFGVGAGIGLYGGFAGTEVARSQRDIAANVTILSGDLAQDDINADGNHIAETPADIQGANAFHVVAGIDGILDGFTVTAGQTDGAGDPNFGYGGGILGFPGAATLFTLRNLTVIGNEAVLGGGIFLYNGLPGSSLTNVTVTGNTAGQGGGVYLLLATLAMTNVTISGNTATAEGGGLFNDVASATFVNATISGNTATTGGGTYNYSGSTLALTNTIVWGNTGGSVVDAGSSATIDDSVIEGGCPASGATCTNVSAADPFLQALADNGGIVQTSGLGVGSSALDTADNTACPAIDARGFARDASCDIGAFEAAALGRVTITLDPLDGEGGSPVGQPVVVPAAGGTVYFSGGILNNLTATLTAEMWPTITFPGGQIAQKRKTKAISIAAGDTRNVTGSVAFAASFPAGTYTYTGYVGTEDGIVGFVTITFEKAAARSGAPALTDEEIRALDADTFLTFGDEALATTTPGAAVPTSATLGAAYPNPFNPSATVPFALANAADVRLAVYDVLGREVAVLVDGPLDAGAHTAVFEAGHLASGTYLVRMTAAGSAYTRQVTLLK